METNTRRSAASRRLAGWSSCVLGVALAVVAVTESAAAAETPGVFAAVPGFSVRNGDWVAVDGLGILVLGQPVPRRLAAVVLRGEVGLGGSSAGIGLATNVLGLSPSTQGWSATDFIGSGVLSLEGRLERMYGPTSWRRTTYVGGQISFSAIICKPALGWMVAADDPRDRHFQIVFAGAGW